MKVYARTKRIHDENCLPVPYNVNIANAIEGFHDMGFEIHCILQVNHCLNKFGIVSDNTDYPDVLQKYLGRKIWTDKIDHINNHPELFPVFVKPVVDKKFNGTVVHSIKDLIGCGSCYENSDILCSEIVDFIFECRGFIYYDEMIDLRPYKGNWRNMNLVDTKIIDN